MCGPAYEERERARERERMAKRFFNYEQILYNYALPLRALSPPKPSRPCLRALSPPKPSRPFCEHGIIVIQFRECGFIRFRGYGIALKVKCNTLSRPLKNVLWNAASTSSDPQDVGGKRDPLQGEKEFFTPSRPCCETRHQRHLAPRGRRWP